MKRRFTQNLSIVLAALLQIAPLIRSAIPAMVRLAPSTWAIILRWGTGAVAMFGCHAVSKASSIAISPPNATVGVPYVGTVTYSGGHAGSVNSMKLTNNCLSVGQTLAPGLTVVYSSANKAVVNGTPTTAGTFPFRITVYEGISCASGHSDSRNTSLIVGASGGGGVIPSFSTAPESGVAQVGSDVILSAGASGNPIPQYSWKIGITPIPGETNSTLAFTNIQLTSAGLYTVTASNASGTASATAYLSVCVTPGSNILALNYTNYAAVSNALLMTSYITNAPAGSNVYKWQYNYVDVTAYNTSGSNFNIPANGVFAGRSGTYLIVFNGVVGATTVVNQQPYESYWAFGAKPVVTSPPSTNVAAGANVTLTASGSTQQNPYGNGLTNGFLWYKDGSSVVAVQANAGSNQISSLTFSNVDPTNAGIYTVVCTNYWGSATSSPAILTVTSSSPPAPQLKTTFALPGGPFVLGFTNNPGTSFTVLYSSNVSLPLGSWTPLGPATEISPGQYQFSDAGVPTNSQRFFRVRSP